MKRRLRTAGLVMLAAAAALVIFWESGGRERFMYERIPVMASDVTRGTVITGSMITLTSSPGVRGCLSEGDGEDIIGMAARHDIHAGMPIFDSDLIDPAEERKGKLVMTVPSADIANGIAGICTGDDLILMFDGAEMAKTKVLSISEDRAFFDVALTRDEAVRMSECSANGRRPVIMRE